MTFHRYAPPRVLREAEGGRHVQRSVASLRTPPPRTAPVREDRPGWAADPSSRPGHDLSKLPVRGGRAGLLISSPGDRWEREADRIAARVVSTSPHARPGSPLVTLLARPSPAGPGASSEPGGHPFARELVAEASRGSPLDPEARSYFEPRFGRDLSAVRIHRDARAAALSRRIGARAFTSLNHIFFASGQPAARSPAGRRLVAHELTHTLQQTGGARAALPAAAVQRQPTSLGDIPEAERLSIRVSTVPIAVPPERVTAFFSLNASGRHGETQTLGVTTRVFGAGIDPALQTGLGSIGAWLATSTNALPMHMTIEIELDLSPHGGAQRRYRFTRFTHRTGGGQSATTANVLLVEDVGGAVSSPAQASVPSSVTVGAHTFQLHGSWSEADYALLHQAISLLPAAARTAADGLTFRRRRGSAPGTEAGHYVPETDTVELFNDSFPAASVRFGGHPAAVRNIVHEIGHALDLRPLEEAWRTFEAAGQIPSARARLLATRSRSGTRWVRDPATGDYAKGSRTSDRSPAFRAAVHQDGVRPRSDQTPVTTPEGTTATLTGGVTTYSDTDYQELYAESFMLYVSTPDTLRALRPRTLAFFQRNFPR